MKKSLITIALAGLAGAALSVSTAYAQVPITSNPGDLILGFFATSGTGAGEDLTVDLGNASIFDNATSPISLTGANALAQADLVATYGASWASNPNLFWGVIAGNGTTVVPGVPTSSIWGTDPITGGTLRFPIQTNGTRIQQGSASLVASGPTNSLTELNELSTPNSTVSAVVAQTDPNSYFNFDQSQFGESFAWFPGNFSSDNSVTNTDASGNSLSQLQGNFDNNAGNPGTVLGTFSLNGGVVSGSSFAFKFTPVPEPSSIGLTGVGFLSLIGFVALRRRRSIMA